MTKQEVRNDFLLFFCPKWVGKTPTQPINHRKEESVMFCSHHDIKIVQRSNRQSAVAAAIEELLTPCCCIIIGASPELGQKMHNR